MKKFGLNKSGYLISIARDQYFYKTDLKKTDKSPHSQLASYLRGGGGCRLCEHTMKTNFITF